MDTAILILTHISFVAWVTFVVWYGIRIEWEADEYGVNTLLTSFSLALALTLIEISILFENDPWRPFARLVVYGLIATAGVQRVWFMVTRNHKTRREVRDGDR